MGKKIIPIGFIIIFCIGFMFGYYLYVNKQNHKPKADIKYIKLTKGIDSNRAVIYFIHFSSDVELDRLFKKDSVEKRKFSIVSREIICPWGVDADFSISEIHKNNYFINGNEIKKDSLELDTGRFNYVEEIGFYKRNYGSDGSGNSNLNKDEIRSSLQNKKCIYCKAYMPIYFYQPYFSKPMCIPVTDILKVIEE